MSSVQTIEVHTAPAYEATIGAGLLRECGARLKTVLGGCRIAVVADSNVAPLYLETVCASLRDAGFAVCSYVFPAGEAHKNFTTLSAILEFLAESQLTRTDCVAALGGGVTGDMAGFAAASYLRGIRYVQLRPRCSPLWIPPSAARLLLTSRRERTLRARFCSPPPCCAIRTA